MGSLTGFLLVYTLGGLTFLPLVIVVVLLHAYLTFPIHDDTAYREKDSVLIVEPGDDIDAIKRAQRTLGEKFQPGSNHEADVAAGYFAVCREYVPGGVNGKPPERNTPVGSATVSTPSPSVYQSMYRSIFDRKPTASPLDNRGVGKPQKKGGNVFYVVLRHGHLMLFDDEEQLEVRHVVSLAHHNVSIYSGGDRTPEGELFIKRNALCLSRKMDAGEITADGIASKPFFLFSENCSVKEDFYFALLRNQERKLDMKDDPPIPLQYDVKDIITLVQRLHSSEEHLQTRWINAVIGRIFLALYRTSEVENFMRALIAKKISRVKTPSYLSKIILRHIDMGEAAPVITNPRLKDLTVDGELTVEADFRYAGNFRIEVAATARIDLGSRFKAREVNLHLAVVLKRLEGHAMVRIKAPPSNRLWICFQTMPKIDMTIEPIVSSRQITYTVILRQIENRIKEVFAESLVFPYWDDVPFYRTENKLWRGGIWADARTADHSQELEASTAQDGIVDEEEHLEDENDPSIIALPQFEKSLSMPVVDASPPGTAYSRKGAKSAINLSNSKASGSSTSIDTRSSKTERPRAIRSGSFTSASSPIVGTDIVNADAMKNSTPPEHSHAGSTMTAVSSLSRASSPAHTPVGSPSRRSSGIKKSGSQSSSSSVESVQPKNDIQNDLPSKPPSINVVESASISEVGPPEPSPTSVYSESDAASTKPFASFGMGPRRESSNSSSGRSTPAETKRLSLAAVTNAAATAKKWGWNALQRQQSEQKADRLSDSVDVPSHPLVMGRGRPLPPPGTPLPPPDRKTKTAPIPVPKRKPIPPPPLPQRQKDAGQESNETQNRRQPIGPPPLPKRRDPNDRISEGVDDGLFVVAAPAGDSEPTTPLSELVPTYVRPWVADVDEDGEEIKQVPTTLGTTDPELPPLPNKRLPHRLFSSSPEEDGPKLPTWMAAQEEEARAKSTFVDEDTGL